MSLRERAPSDAGVEGTPRKLSKKDKGHHEKWTVLDASKAELRVISPTIGQYSFLTELLLNDNQLRMLPGQMFLTLPNLLKLDFSNNQITELPCEVGNCFKLEELLFTNNQISKLPFELSRLVKLKKMEWAYNPIMLPPLDVMKSGESNILSYLREHMPAPNIKVERKWIRLSENVPDPDAPNVFRLMDYNVLSQSYATEQLYHYCPRYALDWNHRKKLILQEILLHRCDVICLQEVEPDSFDNDLLPSLKDHDYDGVYSQKQRAKTMTDARHVDGCAVFYKASKYTMLKTHVLSFIKAIQEKPEFLKNLDGFNRAYSKDNIAQFVLFKNKIDDSKLLVINTHLHWNPTLSDVKLMQTILLIEHLTHLRNSPDYANVPFLIAGDFNCTPDSPSYQLLSDGTVGPDCDDLMVYDYGHYSLTGFTHHLSLRSAYSHIKELPFTNYTADYQGVLDYVWYHAPDLRPTRLLEGITLSQIKYQPLPNAQFPSDHICLMAEFEMYNQSHTQQFSSSMPKPVRPLGNFVRNGSQDFALGDSLLGSGMPSLNDALGPAPNLSQTKPSKLK